MKLIGKKLVSVLVLVFCGFRKHTQTQDIIENGVSLYRMKTKHRNIKNFYSLDQDLGELAINQQLTLRDAFDVIWNGYVKDSSNAWIFNQQKLTYTQQYNIAKTTATELYGFTKKSSKKLNKTPLTTATIKSLVALPPEFQSCFELLMSPPQARPIIYSQYERALYGKTSTKLTKDDVKNLHQQVKEYLEVYQTDCKEIKNCVDKSKLDKNFPLYNIDETVYKKIQPVQTFNAAPAGARGERSADVIYTMYEQVACNPPLFRHSGAPLPPMAWIIGFLLTGTSIIWYIYKRKKQRPSNYQLLQEKLKELYKEAKY